MAANTNDFLQHVGIPGTATTMSAPGHSIAGTSITVESTTNWPTDTGVTFAMDTYTLTNGVQVRNPGTYSEWTGVVTGSTTIGSLVIREGTDQAYPAGTTTRVYIPVSSTRENRFVDGLLAAGITQGGGMGAITPTSVTTPSATITSATITNLTVGSQTPSADWTVIGSAPNTVTYNGQHSYNLVFNGVNYTNILNPGTRLRTTRTAASPTQSTSLNGTTQFYSKSSPASMTFTDDFVASAWIKLSSYSASRMTIASRYNGTSGWEFSILESTGQVLLQGFNASSANRSQILSSQSIPLNKWVHVTAQLDMSTFTATPTTSYVMVDGLDIPSSVGRTGTNPTALIQAGSLEIGSQNGGTLLFPGKIAQVAIYSAKVTQATILASISQTLVGTETSLISAYSFNNSITDLKAGTANNLTANGSAVATNADSPFGGQAGGSISSTLDYGIVESAAFSTNTTIVVQVPEGCTIPTTGGVSAASYSSFKTPYGFPAQRTKWKLEAIYRATIGAAGSTVSTWYPVGQIPAPVGEWRGGYEALPLAGGGSGNITLQMTLSTSNSTESDSSFTSELNAVSVSQLGGLIKRENDISAAAQALYYLNIRYIVGTSITLINLQGDVTNVVRLENAYL